MWRALLAVAFVLASACELAQPTAQRSAGEILDEAERAFASLPSLRARVQGRSGDARWAYALSHDPAAGTRVDFLEGRFGAVKPGYRVWDRKRLLIYDADAKSYRYESVAPGATQPLLDLRLSWHAPEMNVPRRSRCAQGTVLPDERVAGRSAHHLRCDAEELWIDAQTGLILRSAYPDNVLEITEIEYGVTFPPTTFAADAPAGARDERQAVAVAAPAVLRSGTPPLEPQELAAMTLTKSDLGAAYGAFEREEFESGYLDNEEFLRLRFPESLHDPARAAFAKCARVTGYAEAYSSPAAGEVVFVGTLVHLFNSTEGARACLGDLASLEERLRGIELAPNAKVLTVELAAVSGVGEEGLRLRKTMSTGPAVTAVLFRRGRLLGEAVITRADARDVSADVATIARDVDGRIQRGLAGLSAGRKVSAEELMAMALTPAQIGGRYAGFSFDWSLGGFWSIPEIAQNAADPSDERQDIERYGLLVRYLGRFTDPTRPRDAINSSLFLFRDAASAAGYLEDDLADTQRGAHAAIPTASVGEKTIGYQVTRQDVCTTRILFVRGRLIGQVIADCAADAASAAADIARRFDERIQTVLSER